MQLNIEKELAICDELHRLVELNDASLDGDIAAAQELFDDSAAAHYEALLRAHKRLRELLRTLLEQGHLSDSVYIEDEIYAELRQLLDLPSTK